MLESNFPGYAQELAEAANAIATKPLSVFVAGDFVIQTIVLDYGKKSKNPIDYVRFYSKADQDVAKKVRFWGGDDGWGMRLAVEKCLIRDDMPLRIGNSFQLITNAVHTIHTFCLR